MGVTATKERPILFSGPMVRAILDGRKTQTRRLVKLLDADGCYDTVTDTGIVRVPYTAASIMRDIRCPYGQPGDRLWVREAWCGYKPTMRGYFKADGAYWNHKANKPLKCPGEPEKCKWKPSIHMPRWASRITLEITGVRVERLQDISEADAVAEGFAPELCTPAMTAECEPGTPERELAELLEGGSFTAKYGFELLWKEINGRDSWAANPWVWVVEFKRIEQGAA